MFEVSPRGARRACLALVCATSAPAWAQVKADGLWRGSAGAALSAASGNSESSALALNADLQRATDSDKITLGAAANYARGKVNGVTSTTSNKWTTAGQYDFNLVPRLYAFGKLGFEGDALIELALRSTVAGGLGYKFVDTQENAFSVFAGAAYSVDRYDTAQTVDGRTGKRFERSSLLLGEESSHQLATNTRAKQRLEIYPGVSGDKAFLARFSAGLVTAVNSSLNVTLGLTDQYNSKPPVGSKKNDVGLFAGISVRFGAP